MSKRRYFQAVFGLPGSARRLVQRATKRFVLWLLRSILLIGQNPYLPQAGFVLPTTVLLLLVVSLTVGAITLRTFNRTEQVVGGRQQQVVYNAATPAIDRAKAKLEYMFNRQRDPRLPSGIPGEGQLYGMLVNDEVERNGVTVRQHLVTIDGTPNLDPYTFPDEQRIDLDGDGVLDNAWSYRADTDGDGAEDSTVGYSVLFSTPVDPTDMEQASDGAIANRANDLQVRHGPLSSSGELNAACQVENGAVTTAPIEAGWFRDRANSSVLRKNFQVDAYVLPDDLNGTVATLEFHQDRQLNQGNKWGAWFRNDLEIFPGPEFNWNGAMHTEGSLVVGGGQFRGYLVSSPSSCIYTRDASEVTVTDIEADPGNDIPAFEGQILSGTIKDNSFATGDVSQFHLFGTPPVITGNNNIRLDRDRDSVQHGGSNPNPGAYALDPLALATRDVSQARGIDDPHVFRAADWNPEDKMFVKEGRIYNQQEDPPYLDDFYRADNRYGPKPRYAKRLIPVDIGEPITGIDNLMADQGVSDDELINDDAFEAEDVGLDGYWERRAAREGLRLIVGQRLELGNAFGWGLDINGNEELDSTDDDGNGIADEREAEPLYPADACPSSRCHETLQRQTLYDNLAAVQSLAIYHANNSLAGSDSTFPVACFALTAHPGTAATIKNSRTFMASPVGDVNTNFLEGIGTNGWEFEPPAGVNTEAAFATAIADDQPLGIALRNLAHFAGDPRGGTPSFPAVQELATGNTPDIHPYPNLTMWGDYSMLRRILAMLDDLSEDEGNPVAGGLTYEELSPADKATLHTAACTLGMLAYNLDTANSAYASLSGTTLSNLGEALWELVDGDPGTANDDEVNLLISPAVPFPIGYDRATDAADFYAQFSMDQYLEALRNKPNLETTFGIDDADLDQLAQIIVTSQQVRRDRSLGFLNGGISITPSTSSRIDWNPTTQLFTEGLTSETLQLKTACDPDIFSNDAITAADDDEKDEKKIGLALAFCSEIPHPKYPSLYYLFPYFNHDQNGANDSSTTGIGFDHTQPIDEAYIRDTYIFDPTNTDPYRDGVNTGYTYQVVGDDNDNGLFESGEDDVDAIALTPRALNFSNWALPVKLNPATSDINLIYNSNASPNNYTSNRIASLPFLDKGIMNGREVEGLRVLDIDWRLLHNNTKNMGPDERSNTDHWLPNSGVVYAFREDAVREDGIVRPRRADWSDCNDNSTFETTSGSNNSSCRMVADPANPQDPPLYDDPSDSRSNNISPKSVDYYPDPARRPNAFRLRNGSELWRDNDNGRGLSFVSDNPVYIMGDFNLHQTPGCGGAEACRLEEFTQKLPNNGNYNTTQFYNNRTTLETRFARASQDIWRPSEILADAVSIISSRFCDGSMEDGFLTAGTGSGATVSNSGTRYGCSGNGDRTSFLNWNRPETNPADDGFDWVRANPEDPDSPVVISRSGMPLIQQSGVIEAYDEEYDADDFYTFDDSKPVIGAQNSRVNAIIISGLVPSRGNQAYGGLHNFPRFLETWSRLYISGAFLQLNFSNYATAPFDQDSWETDENARSGTEQIRYYSPPNRLWGYDVGLQYAPAGPIAERFVTPVASRSEFYSEPPSNDQYMINLCRQIAAEPDDQCAAP